LHSIKKMGVHSRAKSSLKDWKQQHETSVSKKGKSGANNRIRFDKFFFIEKIL